MAVAPRDPVRRVDSDTLSLTRVLRDVLAVAALAGCAALVGRSSWLLARLPSEQTSHYLAFAAGAVGLAAGAVSGVVYRLSGDRRAAWAAAALAVYSLIAVPAATLDWMLKGGQSADNAADVVSAGADTMVALTMLMCAQPLVNRTRQAVLTLLGIGFLGTALAGLAMLYLTPATGDVFDLQFSALLVVWLVAGALIVWRAITAGLAPGVRVGLGVLVLGFGSGLRESGELPAPSDELTFSVLRLLGLLVVLLGIVQMAWRSLRVLAEHEQGQREKLRQAEAGLAQIAERNHELRNGIAGLAGVTEMLDRPVDETRLLVMRSALAAELCRLDALLDGDLFDAGQCEVAEVLREVEILWQASGLSISLDAPAGLVARMPRAVLIQTMANLLTNCMRHAPGSPVRVHASRHGDRVSLQVSDLGPGLPPGTEHEVFNRGVKGAGSTGRGLGLTITRKLLAVHGGSIEVDPAARGCTVVVEFPLLITSAGTTAHRG